jgi:hypothetical protein
MCYGDTITIEVSAVNHGIDDLNNATQVLAAIDEGHAVARVVGVEHWTDPASLGVGAGFILPSLGDFAPLMGILALVVAIGAAIWIFWPHSEVPKR